MKALSIMLPWAGLIRDGKKTIETRTWRTNFRGTLLICASKTVDLYAPVNYLDQFSNHHLRGQAVAVADLVDCRPMTTEDETAALCGCEDGRYAWILENIRPIEPFKVRGWPALFDVEYDYVNHDPVSKCW